MTIIQLEYFLAVVNHGSFSAAAEHCFVSQPSLSIQISNLEEELGVTLLDRNQKPITPTEIGLLLLEQAKVVVTSFYGTKETINGFKGKLLGKLRLGIIPTIAPYLLPQFLLEFVKRCPKVELDIFEMHTASIIDHLNKDELDIAILSGGESVKITETKLFDDKLYLYVSPKNPLYEKNTVQIDDIDMKKLLLLSDGNCLRNQVLRLCQAKKKIKSQYNFVTSSLETLMHTVDTTSAMTIIPGMAIRFIPEEKHRQIKILGRNSGHRKITMAVGRTFVKEALVHAVRESALAVAEKFKMWDFLHA